MTDTAAKPTAAPQQAKTEDAPIVKADFDALAKVKVAGELDLLTTAKAFAASGMFSDVRTQSQAIVKIVAGYELGIPPFAAMQGFHCIPRRKKVQENGAERWIETVEVTMSANLRAAIVRRDGTIDLDIIEQSDTACEVAVAKKFAGEWKNKGTVRFTIEQAKKVMVPAGGGKTRALADGDMWKNYPADMLFAAVMRRISKRYAPHLFIGDAPGNDEDDLITAAATEEAPIEAEIVEETSENETHKEGPTAATGNAAGPATTDAKRSDGGSGNGRPDGGDAHAVARAEDVPESDPEPGAEPKPDAHAVAPEPAPERPEAPADDATYVGLLRVPPAGDGPWLATDGKDLRTKDQCATAEKLLAKLSLVPGALAAICKARYGVVLGQVSKVGMDELNTWLEARAAAAMANSAAANEEPPF